MGAAPVLTILKDGQTIKSQALEGEVLLGRSDACVIRLDDRAISRQHAVLRPVEGGVQVEKKSEFAPLSVNGSECTSALVKEGDVIAIGPYLLRLSGGAGEMAAQPAAPSAPLGMPADPSDSAPAPTIPLELGAEAAIAPVEIGSPLDSVPGAESAIIEPVAPAGDAAPEILPVESSPEPEAAPLLSGGEAPPSDEAPAAVGESQDFAPAFSLDAKAPEGSDPIDLGEISIDEDGATKFVSQAKIEAKLVIPSGAANVAELDIRKDEISIGRGSDCDLILDDKKASRRHAIIRRSGVSFSIVDLDSANGTFVNGSKVHEHSLSGEDTIRIGSTEIRFVAVHADYAAQEQNFMPVPDAPAGGTPDIPLVLPMPGGSGAAPPLDPQALAAAGAAGASAAAPFQFARPEPGSGPVIAGLAGIGGVTTKKKSLFQKYRELPPRRKAIWTVILIAAVYLFLFDDAPPQAPVHHKSAAVASKSPATFDDLTPAQKKFVIAQHDLAFDYYKNRDYDKAIFEIDKIFALIPDYKDSREIERYAKEGKRKLEALQEEQRKEQEQAQLKLKIAELVDDAKALMDQKKYDKVGDLFSQILALDPDNQQVAAWSKTVDAYNEQMRIEQEQREVQQQINARAWDLYKEGMGYKEQRKWGDAIADFKRVAEIGATDKKVEREAAARIRDIEKLIADQRDPVLEAAKQAEVAQEYAKAYKLYEKATEIDPSFPLGYAGMDRIRGILHEKAKALYIDAVLAESYSDFDTAKKKFEECLNVAPKEDIYHDRAQRKLASFFTPGEISTGDDSGAADDASSDDSSSGPAASDESAVQAPPSSGDAGDSGTASVSGADSGAGPSASSGNTPDNGGGS